MSDDDEYFMLRPVEAGLCSYRDLTDGTVDYADLVGMHEFLDVKEENEYKASQVKPS